MEKMNINVSLYNNSQLVVFQELDNPYEKTTITAVIKNNKLGFIDHLSECGFEGQSYTDTYIFDEENTLLVFKLFSGDEKINPLKGIKKIVDENNFKFFLEKCKCNNITYKFKWGYDGHEWD